MILLELFLSFFHIGLFSFGGGYAMIPFIQQVVVDRGYISISEFADMLAISQITPGPIAINMATFVGFTQAGVLGSLIATLGVVMPSFLIVIVAFKFIIKFNKSPLVKDALHGLKPAVCALIFVTAIQIAENQFGVAQEYSDATSIAWSGVILAISIFLLAYKTKVSPILLIAGSAVIGLLFGFLDF